MMSFKFGNVSFGQYLLVDDIVLAFKISIRLVHTCGRWSGWTRWHTRGLGGARTDADGRDDNN